MKCFIESFQELDIDELLKVNGGYGSPSGQKTQSSSYQSNSYKTSGGNTNAGYSNIPIVVGGIPTTGNNGVKGGYVDLPVVITGNKTTEGIASGVTSGYSEIPVAFIGSEVTQDSLSGCENNSGTKQVCTNPDQVHCDIIAYNTAIDNGVKNPGSWDGNNKSVDQIYNENYASKASSELTNNTKGYIVYDWENDGTYDHIEYYQSSSNNHYTCWNNEGFESGTNVTNYDFTVDKNGHADTGTAKFIVLE